MDQRKDILRQIRQKSTKKVSYLFVNTNNETKKKKMINVQELKALLLQFPSIIFVGTEEDLASKLQEADPIPNVTKEVERIGDNYNELSIIDDQLLRLFPSLLDESVKESFGKESRIDNGKHPLLLLTHVSSMDIARQRSRISNVNSRSLPQFQSSQINGSRTSVTSSLSSEPMHLPQVRPDLSLRDSNSLVRTSGFDSAFNGRPRSPLIKTRPEIHFEPESTQTCSSHHQSLSTSLNLSTPMSSPSKPIVLIDALSATAEADFVILSSFQESLTISLVWNIPKRWDEYSALTNAFSKRNESFFKRIWNAFVDPDDTKYTTLRFNRLTENVLQIRKYRKRDPTRYFQKLELNPVVYPRSLLKIGMLLSSGTVDIVKP